MWKQHKIITPAVYNAMTEEERAEYLAWQTERAATRWQRAQRIAARDGSRPGSVLAGIDALAAGVVPDWARRDARSMSLGRGLASLGGFICGSAF